MALVFQDGFDNWGSGSTSRTNMVNSSNMWTSVSSAMGCTTTVSRTGTHSLIQPTGVGSSEAAIFSLGGARTSASGYHGFGFAFRIANLPVSAENVVSIRNTSSTTQYALYVSPTGALVLIAASTLATSASGLITPNVFAHIEIKQKVPTTYNATDGEIYVKVNGTLVLSVTGVDTTITSAATAADFETVSVFAGSASNSFGHSYIDDLYVWDSTGTYCNDWIGNKACYTYFCDADTATAQWTINGTTLGYDAINDTTPDADSTYLAATSAGVTSIFELPTVNSSLTGISAVTVHSAIRQDSSGVSEIQVALGNSAYTNGASRVAPFPGGTSTTYTVYQDHFYQDPDGAGNLTPSIVSALKLKLMRTV